MEKTHKRKKFNNFFAKNERIPKVHYFRDGIKDLSLDSLKNINKNIIKKAKENKVYKQGTVDNFVVVGIDGTENFGSHKKFWDNCYKCKIKNQKYIDEKKQIVEEEYHKQINVFARIVGKRPRLVLDYEKITCNRNEGKQEYEPNVAVKLINKLRNVYGNRIDVIVGDAIYLKDTVIETLQNQNYVGVFRLKDNNKKILEDAKGLFKIKKLQKFKLQKKNIEY